MMGVGSWKYCTGTVIALVNGHVGFPLSDERRLVAEMYRVCVMNRTDGRDKLAKAQPPLR